MAFLTKFVSCLKKSYPITCLWRHGGKSQCIALPIYNLGAGWGWLVSAMPWVLFPWKRALVLHCIDWVGTGVRSFVLHVLTMQHPRQTCSMKIVASSVKNYVHLEMSN